MAKKPSKLSIKCGTIDYWPDYFLVYHNGHKGPPDGFYDGPDNYQKVVTQMCAVLTTPPLSDAP
jgi:hypothetical protein